MVAPVSFPAVASLVPHRPPMLLIDALIEASDDRAVCAATPREGGCFVVDGVLPAEVFLEHMAQTVAALVGWRAAREGGVARRGFLVGAMELVLYVDGARVGDALTVEATRLAGDDEAGSFRCVVRRGGEALAEATLSVMLEPA